MALLGDLTSINGKADSEPFTLLLLQHFKKEALDQPRLGAPAQKDFSTGSSSTWLSRMGPERGIKWRGGTPPAPPAWKYEKDDMRVFAKWKRKIARWELQIAPFMQKKEAALLLYNSLTEELESELEHVLESRCTAPMESTSSSPLGVTDCSKTRPLVAAMYDEESRGNRLRD